MWNDFPFTNYHDINADWLVSTVKKWVLKTEEYFLTNDEAINYLKNNFADLKQFVMNYFDSLDVAQEVSDKLDEMLESGALDDILAGKIVTFGFPRASVVNGKPIHRERYPYYDDPTAQSGLTRAMQNGTIYSASGDYSLNATGKILYYYQTWSNDENCSLIAYDIDNRRRTAVVPVPNGAHGGGLYVKERELYSICWTNNLLVIFDISDPQNPIISEMRNITLNANLLIGYYEAGHCWLCSDDASDRVRSVYAVNDSFTEETYLYDLTTSPDIPHQDYDLDNERGLIYAVSTFPNVIAVFDVVTGEPLTDLSIPKTCAYINTGETEFIFAHGDNIYFGGMSTAGTTNNTQAEFVTFGFNTRQMHQTRGILNATNGPRTIYVGTQYDELNPNVNTLGGANLCFRYFEDAFNHVRDINYPQIIFLNSDYPEGIRVGCDCRINMQSYKHSPIRVDNNVNVEFMGLLGDWLGNPMEIDDGSGNPCKCMFYLGRGSNVTITGIDTMPIFNNADVTLYSYYSTVKFMNRADVRHALFRNSIVFSNGIIKGDVYANASQIYAYGIEIDTRDYQFFSPNTYIEAQGMKAGTRPTFSQIYNRDIPYQFMFTPVTGQGIGGYPVQPLQAVTTGSGTLRWAYWNGSAWQLVETQITRKTVDSPVGHFTAYKYELTGTLPSGIANYPGYMKSIM